MVVAEKLHLREHEVRSFSATELARWIAYINVSTQRARTSAPQSRPVRDTTKSNISLQPGPIKPGGWK